MCSVILSPIIVLSHSLAKIILIIVQKRNRTDWKIMTWLNSRLKDACSVSETNFRLSLLISSTLSPHMILIFDFH